MSEFFKSGEFDDHYDSTPYYQSKKYFEGKNIIVTGATGGIGSLLVKRLLSFNAKVFVICKSLDNLRKDFQAELDQGILSYKLFNFAAEYVSTENMKEIMGTLKGRLDALILCHGRYDMSSTNPRDFDKAYATNVRSCYNLISLCTPFLKVTKGCIVAISSQEAEIPSPNGMLNTVTKTMLNSLIQNTALELASFGVRANAVAPAMTDTNMRTKINKAFGQKENEDYLKEMGGYFPLWGKVIYPEDIVDTILFLACEESEFMTGEIITVDGGYGLNHDLSFTANAEKTD